MNKEEQFEEIVNCHMDVFHNGQHYDVNELVEALLDVNVTDQNGSEFEVLEELENDRIKIRQYSYEIEFDNDKMIEEHIMDVVGKVDYKMESFIPESWEVLEEE